MIINPHYDLFKDVHTHLLRSSKLLLTPSSTSTALSKSTPTASSTPSKILNDTSIAAHHRPNGDRHLFFQDNTGAVRQAMYSKSLNQWIRTLDLVVTLDAKNHSPLAAVIWDDDLEDVALPKVKIKYI